MTEYKAIKIAVIGSGVIGLTTAYALARRGATVTVFEASRFGGNASPAAGGILAPLRPWEFSPTWIELWQHSLSQWRYLLDRFRTQCTIRLVNSGVLYSDETTQVAAAQWARQKKVRGEVLNQQALRQRLPMLNTRDGFLLDDVEQIEMADLINALFHFLRLEKVSFVNQSADLIIKNQCVIGVQTSAENFATDCVTVCAGAWSSKLFAVLPQGLIRPRRGQIVQYAGVDAMVQHIVVEGERYLIPCSGKRLLVGSIVEDSEFDDGVTPDVKVMLTTFAERLMPDLQNAVVQKHWAGLRPGITRELPLIGRHPEISGLFFNVGHFRNGIGLAPGSAALLSAIIYGLEPPVNPTPFGLTKKDY